MIRLAVVDDHHFVRLGIQHHFAQRSDIVIVASAESLAGLDANVDEIDVLLIDLHHDATLSTLGTLLSWARTTPVIVMSQSGQPADVIAAVQAGASGYLVKDAPPDAFASAVKEVAAGGFAWSPGLAGIVERWLNRPVCCQPSSTPLSTREREVLGCLAQGLTHRQIATRLGVAQSTVDTYVKRIRTKLNLGNKAELTRCALELGIHVDEPPAGPQ